MQTDVQRRQTAISYTEALGIVDVWPMWDRHQLTQASKDAVQCFAVIRQHQKAWYKHECLTGILHILSVLCILLNAD